MIDTTTNTVTATIPVGNQPTGIVFSPDHTRAYVATRTDGFPLRGGLDGNGPGMDWIINLNDQTFVYGKLTAALNMLQAM